MYTKMNKRCMPKDNVLIRVGIWAAWKYDFLKYRFMLRHWFYFSIMVYCLEKVNLYIKYIFFFYNLVINLYKSLTIKKYIWERKKKLLTYFVVSIICIFHPLQYSSLSVVSHNWQLVLKHSDIPHSCPHVISH